MMNPVLWEVVPFRDPDAFSDWLQTHDAQHQQLAKVTGTRWQPLDDLKTNLEAHSQLHILLAKALNVPQVDDLLSFDLTEEVSYLGFMLLNAQDHTRLNAAAGIK